MTSCLSLMASFFLAFSTFLKLNGYVVLGYVQVLKLLLLFLAFHKLQLLEQVLALASLELALKSLASLAMLEPLALESLASQLVDSLAFLALAEGLMAKL